MARGPTLHIRLINIGSKLSVRFTLESSREKLRWRVVGKDGMALPPAQIGTSEADQVVAVGETFNIEGDTPKAGELRLRTAHVLGAISIKTNVVETPIRLR